MGLTVNGVTTYVHPTFLYESLWNLTGFIALHVLSKKTKRRFDGEYFLAYVLWYGLGRAWIEGLRADSLYLGNTGLRVSQLLAAAAAGVSAVLLAALARRAKKTQMPLWADRAAMAEAGSAGEAEDEAEIPGDNEDENK